MLCFDRRLVIYLIYGGDQSCEEIIQLAAWFLVPPPFGDKAFKMTIAPTYPWSEKAINEANYRYKNLGKNSITWKKQPSNPIYREAVIASDVWKLFIPFLQQMWGKLDSTGLVIVPILDDLEKTIELLQKLYKEFTKTTQNKNVLEKFQWPFMSIVKMKEFLIK